MGYTVMSNHHLRNKDLSLKAKGLLSQMLSLPEDWDFTLAGLSYINREKIDAIREGIYIYEDRASLIAEMSDALPYMDEDMRDLANRTLEKLRTMTDEEFAELDIYAADEE